MTIQTCIVSHVWLVDWLVFYVVVVAVGFIWSLIVYNLKRVLENCCYCSDDDIEKDDDRDTEGDDDDDDSDDGDDIDDSWSALFVLLQHD